ncbi:MAG: hypothetical protein J2P13_12585 [Acidobacteria bacterium]|nr:hypothetical protein [Acidobacteriota bacterium]
MSRDVSAFLVTVRSRDTGWSGMVLAEAASDARPGGETRLVLVNSRGALVVRRLCLPESGVALDYPIATAGKLVYLARTPPAGIAVASASSGR